MAEEMAKGMMEKIPEKWRKLREARKKGTLKYTDLIVDKKYPIATITINRPEKRNTLTTQVGGTVDQLAQAYEEMAEDPEVRVFIVQGTGDCFCAGFDMGTYDEEYWLPRESWAKGREKEAWSAYTGDKDNPEASYRTGIRWWHGLWENPTPSIALVRSFCLGAGMANANLCDIVFATPDAVFAYPPVRYGASLWAGAIQPWLLGLRRTMDMCLTGRFISAQEAYDCGLITAIVPEDKIEEEVRKKAESIAKVPPMTNYYSKKTAHHYFEGLGIRQWLDYADVICGPISEQSSLPGHYWDFFDLVRKHGFREAYSLQREKWGYPDPNLDREVARLSAKKKK